MSHVDTEGKVLPYKKVGRWVFWHVVSNKRLTQDEAAGIQTEHGFMPAGYGCGKVKHIPTKDAIINEWKCYASCD